MAGASALIGALCVLQISQKRTHVRSNAHVSSIKRSATSSIETFLVQGPVDTAKLAARCAPLAAHIDLNCVVFFSLGVSIDTISAAAGGALGLHGLCSVFIADCYGIIGWDEAAKKNLEFMELGRGSEYGHVGGQGGEGVVVVAFRGDEHKPTTSSTWAPGCGVHMAVTTDGLPSAASAGVMYGGVAKGCYKLEHAGDVVAVPQFGVSSGSATVSSFDGDAGDAASAALQAVSGSSAPQVAGFFPCFCRGFNQYGENNVEPDAFASNGLAETRLFGMFAHGEIGPPKGMPVSSTEAQPSDPALQMHSMTSILALY